MSAERMVVVDGNPARVVFDLVGAPRAEVNAYLAGRVDGYLDGEAVGYTRGWQACDDEVSSLQRAAHCNVQAMAKILPHEERERRRHERQLDAAERHARAARPWAQEAAS